MVCEALVERVETLVVEALLRNDQAKLSGRCGGDPGGGDPRPAAACAPMLLRRRELRPNHAYVLFWWADAEARRTILQRFAVSREVLQEAAGDVFPMAAEESWQDRLARKALQFIERRQRNRAAIEKSPYDSLDAAIAGGRGRPDPRDRRGDRLPRRHQADDRGQDLDRPRRRAAGHPVQGHRPAASRRCARCGAACKRRETDASGALWPAFERVLIIYDMIAVDRAQTVLRYWNWSLSSALTPALMRAIREGDDSRLDDYSTPQRAAMLVLSADLAR